MRKHKRCAQKIAVLLVELAHNVLIWAKRWLQEKAPRLAAFGIIRLINDVWAIPGQVKLLGDRIKRVRLSLHQPQTHQVLIGLQRLRDASQTLGILA